MTDVVVDPGIPEHDARLIRGSGAFLVKMRAGWVPEPGVSRSRVKGAQFALAGVLLIIAGVMLARAGAGAGGLLALLLGVGGFAAFAVFLTKRELGDDDDLLDSDARKLYERLRWYEGRYVFVEDLDESSRRLLTRARRAIYAVMNSVVNSAGLLDDVRNTVMLPAQEWEIARLLAKLSSLRAKHRRTVSEGVIPEVAVIAEPLGRALDSSEAAVVARVEALERYAVNVAEAERAYRAHHQIEELRGRLHQYEELVAESGADGFAVPEIGRLADDADHLEQALRRSVNSAQEAFRYLDGPAA